MALFAIGPGVALNMIAFVLGTRVLNVGSSSADAVLTLVLLVPLAMLVLPVIHANMVATRVAFRAYARRNLVSAIAGIVTFLADLVFLGALFWSYRVPFD